MYICGVCDYSVWQLKLKWYLTLANMLNCAYYSSIHNYAWGFGYTLLMQRLRLLTCLLEKYLCSTWSRLSLRSREGVHLSSIFPISTYPCEAAWGIKRLVLQLFLFFILLRVLCNQLPSTKTITLCIKQVTW